MQLSFCDLGKREKKITKPIRLIELFAGIGSQAKALSKLTAFEHHRVCEIDKYALCSYNAIHNTDFEPCDITQLKGTDLGIVDTKDFEYILTYSFPCTDLSPAGKRQGMEKGTRSGLLWEVERLLNECHELPQVLLMENVPQVHNAKNGPLFKKWVEYLESKGYSNHWKDLNSTDFGVAQSRNRCFMISIQGSYLYDFPQSKPLELKLKDYLESDVDKRYFLNQSQINAVLNSSFDVTRLSINDENGNSRTLKARDFKDPMKVAIKEEFNLYNLGMKGVTRYSGAVLNTDGACTTISTMQGGNREPKICSLRSRDSENPSNRKKTDNRKQRLEFGKENISNTLTTVQKDNLIYSEYQVRKLTPLECWRLMGQTDEDFQKARTALNHKFYKGKDRSSSQLYKQAGNSIVVDVLKEIFKELVI